MAKKKRYYDMGNSGRRAEADASYMIKEDYSQTANLPQGFITKQWPKHDYYNYEQMNDDIRKVDKQINADVKKSKKQKPDSKY